jgi:hypothetical protein
LPGYERIQGQIITPSLQQVVLYCSITTTSSRGVTCHHKSSLD